MNDTYLSLSSSRRRGPIDLRACIRSGFPPSREWQCRCLYLN